MYTQASPQAYLPCQFGVPESDKIQYPYCFHGRLAYYSRKAVGSSALGWMDTSCFSVRDRARKTGRGSDDDGSEQGNNRQFWGTFEGCFVFSTDEKQRPGTIARLTWLNLRCLLACLLARLDFRDANCVKWPRNICCTLVMPRRLCPGCRHAISRVHVCV